MNHLQEVELNLSIFHYFVWKERQAKYAEGARKALASRDTANKDTTQSAADQGSSPDKSKNAQTRQKSPTVPSNLASKSSKYKAMADAMLQHFPDHLTHFKEMGDLQTTMPPVITTLYVDYPALQAANMSTRAHITHLDSNLTRANLELAALKQQMARATAAAGKKESVKGKKRGSESKADSVVGKKMRVSKQRDVAVETVQRLHPQLAGGGKKTKPASSTGKTADGRPPSKNSPPKQQKQPRQVLTFEERLEELEHYRKGNGHCLVPTLGTALGRWVRKLREIYKDVQKGCISEYLTPERIKTLDEMGFVWSTGVQVRPWMERFENLKRFKEKFGHCNVPRIGYQEDPSLGEWVHMQRNQYKKKSPTLMGERAELLNSIGFVWSTGITKPSFEQRLEQCRDFRRKNGHLNVPLSGSQSEESYETRSFCNWAHHQRGEYIKFKEGKKSGLDKYRVRKLDGMGFVWERTRRPRARESTAQN